MKITLVTHTAIMAQPFEWKGLDFREMLELVDSMVRHPDNQPAVPHADLMSLRIEDIIAAQALCVGQWTNAYGRAVYAYIFVELNSDIR